MGSAETIGLSVAGAAEGSYIPIVSGPAAGAGEIRLLPVVWKKSLNVLRLVSLFALILIHRAVRPEPSARLPDSRLERGIMVMVSRFFQLFSVA